VAKLAQEGRPGGGEAGVIGWQAGGHAGDLPEDPRVGRQGEGHQPDQGGVEVRVDEAVGLAAANLADLSLDDRRRSSS
jgi:hypothetical protein